MKLSDEAVSELKKIYLKVYGKDLTDEDAQSLGLRLLSFFSLVTTGTENNLAPIIGEESHCKCDKISNFGAK